MYLAEGFQKEGGRFLAWTCGYNRAIVHNKPIASRGFGEVHEVCLVTLSNYIDYR